MEMEMNKEAYTRAKQRVAVMRYKQEEEQRIRTRRCWIALISVVTIITYIITFLHYGLGY